MHAIVAYACDRRPSDCVWARQDLASWLLIQCSCVHKCASSIRFTRSFRLQYVATVVLFKTWDLTA